MEKNSNFVILLAGDLAVDDRVKNICHNARIIAADGGIKHAGELNITPELWVGDFDSTPPHLLKQYNHVEKLTFERQKDLTDGAIAIDAALNKGAKQICLLGSISGERTDHGLALMLQMMRLHLDGVTIMMSSGEEECWPITAGSSHFDLPENSLFSILPLTELSELSIENAAYPLDKIDIEFGTSHTLSNVANGAIRIYLSKGQAILIARPSDFSGACIGTTNIKT